jgi:DNA polymerase IIIc chi subunit
MNCIEVTTKLEKIHIPHKLHAYLNSANVEPTLVNAEEVDQGEVHVNVLVEGRNKNMVVFFKRSICSIDYIKNATSHID